MENISAIPNQRKYLVSFKSVENWDPKRQRAGFLVTEKLSKIITTSVWSPIIFKNGIRSESNFISSDWAAFDFDEHKDINQAAKELCDYTYIIAPTKSHTGQHHRYRVCIPWEKTITDIHTYRHNIEKLIEQFGADPQCKDAARFFWPSRSIFKINLHGDFLSVENPPRKRVVEYLPLKRPENAQIPDKLITLFQVGVSQGERNSSLWRAAKDLYRAGFEWDDVAKLIRKIPLRPNNLREREYESIVSSARRSEEKRGS